MKKLPNWISDGMTPALRLQLLILFVLVAVGVWLVLWEVIISGDTAGLRLNLGAELLGAAMTYGLLTLLLGGRLWQEEAEQADKELRRELIQKMRSDVRDIAVSAVDELRAHGWLMDGSLDEASLYRANLQGARLENAHLKGAQLWVANLQGAQLLSANLHGAKLGAANLQGANLMIANLQVSELYWANLQGARLEGANLQGTLLGRANLQGAWLESANLQGAGLQGAGLQGAHLGGANLQEARLERANLQGAELRFANLQGADLRDAVFDNATVLPDGTQWTPGTDLARFTDPAHPGFWRSD